ncbi:PIN domain-containing protein [Pyrodictium abyssi]|uniref:PIN domain-containing protein n=1 Tax=Pyrodictium abyssi TaxID=54256 RepID=A0ABM8IZA6_9CREN|nr:hypothetical protein PABY_24460 [Pyrodictium abyssi]
MKFVDSNVLVYYIFESEYSDKAAQLLTQHRDLATSIRVIDEVMLCIHKEASTRASRTKEARQGKEAHYSTRARLCNG